jgi:thymidine phosphorylase
MHVAVGDHVMTGQPLFTVHAASEDDAERASGRVLGALHLTEEAASRLPLFYERVT